LRQKPAEPETPELRIIVGWIAEEGLFDWLYSEPILDEYGGWLSFSIRCGLCNGSEELRQT
jgi:hypothetical protein